MSTDRETLHELADELLVESVREATGLADASPRPGQLRMMHDILDAMLGSYSTESKIPGHYASVGPTGSGKTFAAIVPATVMSMERNERTVMSTESLSLQSQIIDKDAPTVAAAADRLWGVAAKTAVLKGWGNYGCAAKSAGAAQEVLGDSGDDKTPSLSELADRVEAMVEMGPTQVLTATGRVSRSRSALAEMDTITVDGWAMPREEFLNLLAWSLRQSDAPHDDEHHGDKHSYDGVMKDSYTWNAVSVSPAECPGVNECPFGSQCRPAAGRARAAAAQIVVTNHSMLAVQAALAVPVVIGNRKLGVFRHIVIDEAHALTSKVRDSGARVISARRVLDIKRTFERVLGIEAGKSFGSLSITEQNQARIASNGDQIAAVLDNRLNSLAATIGRRESVYKVTQDSDPLEDGVATQVLDWCRAVKNQIPSPEVTTNLKTMMTLRRAHAKVDSFVADVDAAREGYASTARWIEPAPQQQNPSRFARQTTYAALKVSPVDVGPALRSNLYSADVPVEGDASEDVYVDVEDADGYRDIVKAPPRYSIPQNQWSSQGNVHEKIAPRYALSVTAISATLPGGFCVEAGLDTRIVKHPTPFSAAYAGSLLYVPRAVDHADIEALRSAWATDKIKFDTAKHQEWAAGHIEELADANGGSALVLAAKAESGRYYAERLRESLKSSGITVHSQWDGTPVRQLVAAWREDFHSVLVGTKSLMTGVDAPGGTCSLVVIDRIPRAASNPVDDARVEAIMERLEMDRWSADRFVYVADARLLCEQAAGRLVRSANDRGIVAVLDPRLLKVGPFSYNKGTRDTYMAALEWFPNRATTREKMLEFIQASLAASSAA